MTICKICGKRYKAITNTHLLFGHDITIKEYCEKFPNANLGTIGKPFRRGESPWNKGKRFVKKEYYSRPGYYEKIRKEILESSDNKCQKCNSERNLIVHHKIPLMKDGWHSKENCVVLCKKCYGKFHKYKTSENPRYRLKYKMSFNAAHSLKDYQGLCQNIHGHTWYVEVEIAGDELNKCGMLVDFHDVKKVFKEILAGLDHQYLNDEIDFNPTCENLAHYLYYMFKYYFWNLTKVKVYENLNASITYG